MSDAIEEAVRAATAGELIVIPTDTVYGLGTRPDDAAAAARLFEAKGRPRDLELPVLVAGLAAARVVAELDDRAAALAMRFWAGPLTLVLPRTEASRGWDLGGDRETVGVRMPHHPLALAVLAQTGPLAVTSANPTGRPTPGTCEEIRALFGHAVTVYLCEQEPLLGRPSTVVDLAHGEPRILRRGAIGREEIEEAIALAERLRERGGV